MLNHCKFEGAILFKCRDGRDIAIVEREDQVAIVSGPCCSTEPDVVTPYASLDEAAPVFLAMNKPRELATFA